MCLSLSGTLDIRLLMERLKPGEKVACGIRVSGYDLDAGSVLAYGLNGPILLLGSSAEDQAKVMEYLVSSLEPGGTVYILGGAGVVGQEIIRQLQELIE